jgi:hypothetical protein
VEARSATGLSSANSLVSERPVENVPDDADHHSGNRRFLIGISPEQRSASPRNHDRHHFGIVIAITPES